MIAKLKQKAAAAAGWAALLLCLCLIREPEAGYVTLIALAVLLLARIGTEWRP